MPFSCRDLKPENVMVEAATGNIKIIDLGLSKLIASARTLGIGTPGYIAPGEALRSTFMSVILKRYDHAHCTYLIAAN